MRISLSALHIVSSDQQVCDIVLFSQVTALKQDAHVGRSYQADEELYENIELDYPIEVSFKLKTNMRSANIFYVTIVIFVFRLLHAKVTYMSGRSSEIF